MRFPYSSGITPLATAHTYPSSACHCEPVRTLVWQSVFPAEKLGKVVALRANPLRLTHSPKVLLPAMPYRRRSGLPRRFAPRNDMLKHAGVHMAMTWYHGKFVTFFVFAQSTAPPCRRGCGLPRRSAPRNDMQKEGRVRRCKDVGREGVQKAGTCAQVQGRGARGRAEGGGVCAGARRGGA